MFSATVGSVYLRWLLGEACGAAAPAGAGRRGRANERAGAQGSSKRPRGGERAGARGRAGATGAAGAAGTANAGAASPEAGGRRRGRALARGGAEAPVGACNCGCFLQWSVAVGRAQLLVQLLVPVVLPLRADDGIVL